MRGPGRKRSHRRLCNQERRIRKHKLSVQDTSAECDLRLARTPKRLAVTNRRARCTAMRHVKRRWQAFGALPGGCTIRAKISRQKPGPVSKTRIPGNALPLLWRVCAAHRGTRQAVQCASASQASSRSGNNDRSARRDGEPRQRLLGGIRATKGGCAKACPHPEQRIAEGVNSVTPMAAAPISPACR